ncbi:MAG: succinylglutamate desuccinylase/aspartoacylase family protein [Methanobacterium sp.]|jgi:predicted deacylase
MKKITLFKDGTLPKSREIYFYVIMGYIYYWFNNIKHSLENHGEIINQINDENSFKLDIINDVAGGDVTKNDALRPYLPKKPLTDDILKAAKEGTPLITLGDGLKPRVMITAGMHGDELAPQIGALILINELYNKKINGTVYIIPFIAPEASAENNKLFNGENLNLIANIPENPANIVFKTIQSLDIVSLADCHSTSTDPAKNSVIYYPKIASSKIAVYINKITNSTLLALIQYAGMLIVLCNSHKIPSVICEVESPDGVASKESVDVSYNQMKAFLKYHQIL